MTREGFLPLREAMEHSRTAGSFPAEKSNRGRRPEEATAREIREELDTQIEVEERFDVVEYDYPDFHLTMDCFLCRVISGDLTLKEHEAARWLTRETLDQVEWLPADLDLIRKLRGKEGIWG